MEGPPSDRFLNMLIPKYLEEQFLCPITGEAMVNPVCDHEGNSYEQEAILVWLKRNESSPITRNPLREDQLFPNFVLKNLIECTRNRHLSPSSPLIASSDKDQPPLPVVSLQAESNEDGVSLVKISVEDDPSIRHSPKFLVCVIDESYSMDAAAIMHGDSEGSAGLSLLDIVKHATKTVVQTLGPKDHLALVTYADGARLVLPFTQMTKKNRAVACAAVEAFTTRGGTNLWDGLLKAMTLVQQSKGIENANIFLLTDGLPNIHPPRGELPTLVRYKESNPRFRCRISTFGFGYSLDSQLLNDIAMQGNGEYYFIPDSSFVGTVFINAISNVLSTALPPTFLGIETTDGVEVLKNSAGGLCLRKTSGGCSISIPSIGYGQTFDVIFKVNKESSGKKARSPPFVASITVPETLHVSSNATDLSLTKITKMDILLADARARLVSFIRQYDLLENEILARDQLQLTLTRLEELQQIDNSNKILNGMMEDMVGQVAEAYSRRDWYSRWGKHYLLSLARSHELQKCTNFKDPGLQIYATEKFSLIRDTAEDIFCKLPPPKQSLAHKNTKVLRNMSRYYDCSNPCFAAGSVLMADGGYIPVDKILVGQSVYTPTGPAKVRCVVVTDCKEEMQEMVELVEGVLVTPWHPVRERGQTEWKFPEDMGTIQTYACERVYSFVLEDGASFLQIGPFEAVTLGHGIENDPVAQHDYLGTNCVIRDLSKMIGWQDGFVRLAPNPGIRDPRTGLIIRFEQNIASNWKGKERGGISQIKTRRGGLVTCQNYLE